jgi:hypothetical protein
VLALLIYRGTSTFGFGFAANRFFFMWFCLSNIRILTLQKIKVLSAYIIEKGGE